MTGSPVKRCGLRGCLEPTDVRGGPAAPRLPPLALKVPITELWPWQGIRKRPQHHSAQQLGRGTSPSVMPSTAPALHKHSANTTGTILWRRCPRPGITERHRGCSPSSEERLPRAGCVMWARGALCQRGPGSPAAPVCCELVVAFLLGSRHRLQSDHPETGPAGTQLGQERGRR